MQRILTTGIILSRTNYGEADRIISILTPDRGKLRLSARGVRKVKSKLAGGIELFSTSDITYIEGKRDVGTLVSSRLIKHYGNIVKDIERVQLGYELIKLLDKATEDNPDPEYFGLLEQAFGALDDDKIGLGLIRNWFQAQLLRLSGHTPNLQTDTNGRQLNAETSYNFDIEAMAFAPHASGKFDATRIKALRLLFGGNSPKALNKIADMPRLVSDIGPLVRSMLQSSLRL